MASLADINIAAAADNAKVALRRGATGDILAVILRNVDGVYGRRIFNSAGVELKHSPEEVHVLSSSSDESGDELG